MKKVLLFAVMALLLVSCGDKAEESVVVEEKMADFVNPNAEVEAEVVGTTQEEVEVIEKLDGESVETLEEKEVEVDIPVIKTEPVKENTTPVNEVSIKEGQAEKDTVDTEETDDLINDMIGDIDDIFKEIESDG